MSWAESLFPLEIFPAGGLGSPVITTVWIGVLVLAFFNLRVGWVFIGLVVPGYLVPLLVAKPWSALVIVVEALLTFWIVWIGSERLRFTRDWSSLFGRDRFFAFILASVVVRLGLDGYLLPKLATALETRYGLPFDFSSELHSFGLIIVALLANQLWKPGVVTGLAQLVLTTGITFAIVRFGLMEFTNFSLGGLDYAYEDMASSILASPKAYIVLITTAFIASRLNLLYGWEYSGILIPALLALQWYQPTKLLASVAEAWVVLVAGGLLLKTPLLERRTIERASKVVLFFTVSYAYKFLLAMALVGTEWKVSDAYGFGYLLPSLLAVKMHEKRIGLRMTRFTLQTTLVSALAALFVGFGLSLLAVPLAGGSATDFDIPRAIERRTDTLNEVIEELRVSSYRGRLAGSYKRPTPAELRRLELIATRLDMYATGLEERHLQPLLQDVAALELTLEEVGDDFLLLHESQPERGWGFVLIRRGVNKGLVLEVPRSLEERSALPVARRLLSGLNARALISSGATRAATTDGSSDVLRKSGTPFLVFHRALAGGNTLQVRAPSLLQDAEEAKGNRLYAKARLPPGLDLELLETALGPYPVEFRPPSWPNLQRDQSRTGFGELVLDRAGARALLRRSLGDTPAPEIFDQTLDGYLQAWLLEGKGRLAGRSSEGYTPPTIEELLFLDEEVLTPLLRTVRSQYQSGKLTDEATATLIQARRAAALVGYQVIWYRHRETSEDYLVLLEAREPRSHWGTFVLRLGNRTPFLVEVPRPLFERNTFEAGLSLFDRLGAEALLIAGSHPDANSSGSADLVLPQNQSSAFSLASQALLREAGNAHRLAVVLRAFARPPEDAQEQDAPDAMVALAGGARSPAEAGASVVQLIDLLQQDNRHVVMVDGSRTTAGYEVSNLPQARYLDQTTNKQVAILWLSAEVREDYRQSGEDRLLTNLLTRLGVAQTEARVQSLLATANWNRSNVPRRAELDLVLRQFLSSADAVAFEKARTSWPWRSVDRVLDRDTGQDYLILSTSTGPAVAVNLRSDPAPESTNVKSEAELRTALAARQPILFLGEAR